MRTMHANPDANRILLFITVARRHQRRGRDAVSRHRHQ